MATETMTVDQVIAGANLVVSMLLLGLGIILCITAAVYHAPWSMIAGSFAILCLVAATLISSLARFYALPDATPFVLLTLRIMALILLAGGTWTLVSRLRRGERA